MGNELTNGVVRVLDGRVVGATPDRFGKLGAVAFAIPSETLRDLFGRGIFWEQEPQFEVMSRALTRARRALAILEEQAAGYTSLPAHRVGGQAARGGRVGAAVERAIDSGVSMAWQLDTPHKPNHNSYALYFHVVFVTRKREPLIDQEVAAFLEQFFRDKCDEMGVHLLA